MKKLEECLLLLERCKSNVTDPQKAIEWLNMSHTKPQLNYVVNNRHSPQKTNLYRQFEDLIDKYPDNIELQTAYKKFREEADKAENKKPFKSASSELRKKYLNDALDNGVTWNQVKTLLHLYRSDWKHMTKTQAMAFFESEQVSEEERKIFNEILSKLKEVENISKNEKIFYDILKEEITNNPDFENYKDKISVNELKEKQIIDTASFIRATQDVDIFIKFTDGEKEYKGKKFKGIGIQCDGEYWHSLSYGRIDKYFVNRTLNDVIRHNSTNYIIIQWNEKDKRIEKINTKEYAREFIRGRILPILKAVFDNDYKNERFDLATRARQSQNQKFFEVAYALKNKINVFDFKDLKINNLSRYFLLNKKSLTHNDNMFDKNKSYVWFKVLAKDFKPDEAWKEEIYKAVVNNENGKPENSKHSVNAINNFKGKDFEFNIGNFDKKRENRQFARLFNEILKKTR